MPNFSLTNVSNTLSKENNFILFADQGDRQVGAIRAQSLQNFKNDYLLSSAYIFQIIGAFSGVDLIGGLMKGGSELYKLSKVYNKIGVEYVSGYGDYAEWLERENPNEEITVGDIVAIKAGKITKDLTDAEQIMAVSEKPIMLGNAPPADKEETGNKIAFIGQLPVKITGPVLSGDYIIAKGPVTGYGVAVHPADMTIDDYKLVVGRSWDSNENPGPKMVNTLVGMHNNGFLNIMKEMQQKQGQTEDRLKKIESFLQLPASQNNKPNLKAF